MTTDAKRHQRGSGGSRSTSSSVYVIICRVLLCALAAGAAAPSHAAEADKTEVKASYTLLFNGFNVGRYNYTSKLTDKTYVVDSNAKISALFGAFTWKGSIKASGLFSHATPAPRNFTMTFSSKKKTRSVRVGFKAASEVASVKLVPDKPPHRDAVPITAADLRGVVDPLTAIVAITKGNVNPCNKRIPVFDGKTRFDLIMSPKGKERLAEAAVSGQPRELVVCQVKYVPVAGHTPEKMKKSWVDMDRIEIALRRIPKAGLYVPYRITIPSSIGSAEMRMTQVEIGAPNQPRIALAQ